MDLLITMKLVPREFQDVKFLLSAKTLSLDCFVTFHYTSNIAVTLKFKWKKLAWNLTIFLYE